MFTSYERSIVEDRSLIQGRIVGDYGARAHQVDSLSNCWSPTKQKIYYYAHARALEYLMSAWKKWGR